MLSLNGQTSCAAGEWILNSTATIIKDINGVAREYAIGMDPVHGLWILAHSFAAVVHL